MNLRYLIKNVVLVLFVCLLTAQGFSQYRYEKPLTPKETLDRIAGSQAEVDGFQSVNVGGQNKESYLSKKHFHPRRSNRFSMKYLDNDGRPVQIDDSGDLVVNIDQYKLMFESSIPHQITITEPDGTTKSYWYFIYKVVNIDEVPVYGHINFNILTSPEDLEATPEGTPDEKWEELLDRIVGNKETRDLRNLSEFKDEIMRGIKRSMLLNYLDYPDRYLMDLICEKENNWQWDKYGRRYNPLVPSNYMRWRKKLRVEDNYIYPEVMIYDLKDNGNYADCFIIKPMYKSGGEGSFNEDDLTTVKVTYVNGDENSNEAPVTQEYTLEEFKSSEWGTKVITMPMYSMTSLGRTVTTNLYDAFVLKRPLYRLGDVVDQYGHILPAGHPKYQHGILLNSEYTIQKYMHGAHLAELDFESQNSPWAGLSALGEKNIALAQDDENALPTADDVKLIASSVLYFGGILQDFQYIFSDPSLTKELKKALNNPSLYESIRNKALEIAAVPTDQMSEEVNVNKYRDFVVMLLDNYSTLPETLRWTIKNLVIDPTRLYFSEAVNDSAAIIGVERNGYIWEAIYHPSVCWVKTAAPRSYKEGDRVLRNYKLPSKPVWQPDKYRAIGENETTDHKLFVNGMILDNEDYNEDEETTGFKRKDTNMFGEEGRVSSYGDSLIVVSEMQNPYFDSGWGRDVDGKGRPVKMKDYWGNSLATDFRTYKPGDRVTPMEWEAYGARLEVQEIKRLVAENRFNVDRKFLKPNDFLVGLPRLMLAEYGYYFVADEYDEEIMELKPRGRFVNGRNEVEVIEDSEFWRWGFKCDAAGDYDAIIYEELDDAGKAKFEELLARTMDEENKDDEDKATLPFLKIVPMMDNLGIAVDWVNPLTHEKKPLRKQIVPTSEEGAEEAKRLFDDYIDKNKDKLENPDEAAKNTDIVWVKAYQPLPNYIYEHDYQKFDAQETSVNNYRPEGSTYRIDDFVKDYSDEYWRSVQEGDEPNLPDIEDYIDLNEDEVTEYADKMTGLFKTMDRPTLDAAKTNVHYQPGEVVKIEREYISHISRLMKGEEFEDEKFQMPMKMRNYDKVVLKTHPVGKEENVILWGKITSEDYTSVTIEIAEECIPGVATGVAIFSELDKNWDFMNVYVSGLKGPIRKRGFDEKGFEMLGSKPEEGDGANKVQRREYVPHFVHEEWVLMLRFSRPGDEFFIERDKVFFERRFWYRAKVGEDNINERFKLTDSSLDLKLFEE